MKVGIIGAGTVAAASLDALVQRGVAREIVVVNRDRKKAQGLVTDVQYGAVLAPTVGIREGEYDALDGAAIVILTAGVNEKTGGATDRNDPKGRLRLLETNVGVFREVVPRVHAAAPDALVLVATDPPDPLADAVRLLGHERVLSTGTYLDSLRFRFHLGRKLGIHPASVDAQILGEHGTSSVFVWSSARAGGAPVAALIDADTRRDVEHEVRYANITIIEGIGASQHGIGVVCARICEMVLRDEHAVIPIGAYQPNYGVTLSLPSVVGRDGAVRTLEPNLSGDEREALRRSAQTLKDAGSALSNLAAPAREREGAAVHGGFTRS